MPFLEDLGLWVKIRVNGSVVDEYLDEEPKIDSHPIEFQTKFCYRYIESLVDTEFSIDIGIDTTPGKGFVTTPWTNDPNNGFEFNFSIDGANNALQSVLNIHFQNGIVKGLDDYTAKTRRNFRFDRLSTHDHRCDELQIVQDKEILKSIGRICISVHRVIIRNKSQEYVAKPGVSGFAQQGIAISEKSLKGRAIHHTVALSAAVTLQQSPMQWSTEYVDPKEAPIAVFYFKYRSRLALQEELIIPRPAGGPTEADDPLNNLSAEEIRRLARERMEDVNGQKSEPKLEGREMQGFGRPLHIVKIEGQETIDLT